MNKRCVDCVNFNRIYGSDGYCLIHDITCAETNNCPDFEPLQTGKISSYTTLNTIIDSKKSDKK